MTRQRLTSEQIKNRKTLFKYQLTNWYNDWTELVRWIAWLDPKDELQYVDYCVKQRKKDGAVDWAIFTRGNDLQEEEPE